MYQHDNMSFHELGSARETAYRFRQSMFSFWENFWIFKVEIVYSCRFVVANYIFLGYSVLGASFGENYGSRKMTKDNVEFTFDMSDKVLPW